LGCSGEVGKRESTWRFEPYQSPNKQTKQPTAKLCFATNSLISSGSRAGRNIARLVRHCGTLVVLRKIDTRMRRSFSNFQVVKNFVAASTAPLKPKTLRMAEQLVEGNRTALSRAITLIESTREKDKEQAEALLDHALALRRSQSSSDINNRDHITGFRLGIAGPPGAGKSTFVEALGGYLTGLGVSPYKHARKYTHPHARIHTLFA
jgi:hypothetical protein